MQMKLLTPCLPEPPSSLRTCSTRVKFESGPAPQVFVLRKLLAEKVNYTTPADYSFTPAGGTQQRLDRLVAGWVRPPAS